MIRLYFGPPVLMDHGLAHATGGATFAYKSIRTKKTYYLSLENWSPG